MAPRTFVSCPVLAFALAGCFSPSAPEDSESAGTFAPTSGASTDPSAGSTVDPTSDPGDTSDPTDPTGPTGPTGACGDGVLDPGEDCDDGAESATCDADCTPVECGDGYVNAVAGEPCDDGNADNADACLVGCVPASCGDMFIQLGVEDCDDGNMDDTDACLSNCDAASCGDGVVHAGVEQCDDGNANPDDGCDNCMVTCGTDCFSDQGCMTAAGRCIRFTCTDGASSATACDSCFGWLPVSYDDWLNGGYCGDVIDRYRTDYGTTTMCGGSPICCNDPGGCGGSDNAWHFSDGVSNHFVGPCLGCVGDSNCTFWNDVDNGTYTRITACERPMP